MICNVLMLIGLGFVVTKVCDFIKEKKQDREIVKRYKEELGKKEEKKHGWNRES